MAPVINLHEMWFGSFARIKPVWPGINERLKQDCGDGETKCWSQGTQPRPPQEHCRDGSPWEGAGDG